MGGISKFEIRNSKCGNWKLESVKVRMGEGGLEARSLSVGDLGDVAPAVAGRRRALGFEVSSGL